MNTQALVSAVGTLLLVVGIAGCAPATQTAPPAASAATVKPSAAKTSIESGSAQAGDPVTVTDGLLPPMPIAVTSFGAAADGKHLYVLGGYFGEPHSYSREFQSRVLSRVALDGSGAWQTIGEIDEGLQGLAAVAHGRQFCRFGGQRAHNAQGEPDELRSVAEAACFDLDARAWRKLPDLPEGRSSLDAALIGSTVYLGGGWKLDGDARSGTWQTGLLALDLAAPTATWQTIASPIERRALALASTSKALVAIGGLTRSKEVSRQVDVFEPQSARWSRGPDFPADAFGVAAVGIDDAIYASARDGVIYRWAPGEAAWKAHHALGFARFFHRLVAGGPNELIAVGGISGMHTDGRTRHVERIALAGEGPAIESFVFGYPGAAKNRQAIFLDGDFLYLFGGNNSLEQHDFEPHNFVSEGWRLHLPSLQWRRIADYPAARQSMQTVQWGEHALAVGGFGHDGQQAVSHVEAYQLDFEHERFEQRAGLPADKGRTQFGLAEHGGKLWVFGGLNYDPRRKGEASFDHVTSVLVAPAGTPAQAFSELALNMPGPRRAFAAAVLGDRYYMVNGMRGEFELVEDCAVFDFGQQKFSALPCPRAPRLSAQLIPLDGKLYLVGGSTPGEDGLQTDRSIEVYDPQLNRWQLTVAELPFDTRHARALAYGKQILIVSTHQPDARMRVALISPRASTPPR
jgi:N-acetylneuraminic acid mutarotase